VGDNIVEEIYITYSPAAGGTSGHAIINYIDSSGNHRIIEAGPQNTTLSDTAKAAITLNEMVNGSGSSALGRLIAEPPRIISDQTRINPSDLSSTKYVDLPREDIATGTSLSTQWNVIVAQGTVVNNGNFAYAPLSQNSNSFVSSALDAANLPQPTGNAIYPSDPTHESVDQYAIGLGAPIIKQYSDPQSAPPEATGGVLSDIIDINNHVSGHSYEWSTPDGTTHESLRLDLNYVPIAGSIDRSQPGGPSHTSFVIDAFDNHAWEIQSITTDALNRTDKVDTLYDDNRRVVTDYDEKAASTVAYVQTTYDPQARTDLVTTVNDNGSSATTDFDQANGAAWRSITNNYGTTGQLTTQTGIYDSNASWLNYYDSAARLDVTYAYDTTAHLSSVTDYDQAGSAAWASIVSSYNTTGQLTSQVGVNDNNSNWVSYFDNAGRLDLTYAFDTTAHLASVTDYDQAGGAAWETIVTNYNTAGHITSQSGSNDNHSSWVSYFDSADRLDVAYAYDTTGHISTVTDYDQAYAYSWASITNNYNASGQITTQSGNYDNNATWVSYLDAAGSTDIRYDYDPTAHLSTVTDYDQASNKPWVTDTKTYNAVGQVTDDLIKFDNGTSTDQFWDRGTADWTTYTSTFNASGVITGKTGSFDDGDTFSEAFTAGKLTAVTYLDGGANDPLWSKSVETYDSAGRLTTVDWWSDAGVRDERDIFDTAGRPDGYTLYDALGRIDEIVTINDNSHVTDRWFYSDSNTVIEHDIYFYGAGNHIDHINGYDANNVFAGHLDYVYDAGGHVDKISGYDSANHLKSQFFYDDAENLVSDNWYNSAGQLIPENLEPDSSYDPDPSPYIPDDLDYYY
jgi:hypothetical protein